MIALDHDLPHDVEALEESACLLTIAWPRGGEGQVLMLSVFPTDLYARILAGSPDAILICDPLGIVRYWNAAAERIFGFGATEAVGVSLELVIPKRLRARHWAAWEETMRTGVTHYSEGQLLAVPATTKGGRQISIEFSIQLVKGAHGPIEWVVAIIRDVTERYSREKALRAELAALRVGS